MMLFRRHSALLPVLLLIATGGAGWALFGTGSVARAQSGFELRDGDRVLFYGDSITDRGEYTTFVEDYVLTRFPRRKIRFLNAGWAGDRVSGGVGGPIDARLARDVVAYQPTVMTIMLGMNDGGYHRYNTGLFVTYAQGYQSLVRRVRESLPAVRLTLVQPSPYDDVTRPASVAGGYNTSFAGFRRRRERGKTGNLLEKLPLARGAP